MQLSAQRGSSGFGASPLSWLELDAWQRWSRAEPSPVEREWILELDRIWLSLAAEKK